MTREDWTCPWCDYDHDAQDGGEENCRPCDGCCVEGCVECRPYHVCANCDDGDWDDVGD